eukprot:238762-Rhodomonas_salina.1
MRFGDWNSDPQPPHSCSPSNSLAFQTSHLPVAGPGKTVAAVRCHGVGGLCRHRFLPSPLPLAPTLQVAGFALFLAAVSAGRLFTRTSLQRSFRMAASTQPEVLLRQGDAVVLTRSKKVRKSFRQSTHPGIGSVRCDHW